MDLFVLIIIIVFIFIIKYLIDTINSLNGEIREIKEKCIIGSKAVGSSETAGTAVTFTTNSEKSTDNVNNELIKTLVYFKNYFDNNK
jgi:FtsZ-binding cell division protein ZapB